MSLLGIDGGTGGTAPEHMDDPRAVSRGGEIVTVFGCFTVEVEENVPDVETVVATNWEEIDAMLVDAPWKVRRQWFQGLGQLDAEPCPETPLPLPAAMAVLEFFAAEIDGSDDREVAA